MSFPIYSRHKIVQYLMSLNIDEYEVSKALINESDIEELFPSEIERRLLQEASEEFRNMLKNK